MGVLGGVFLAGVGVYGLAAVWVAVHPAVLRRPAARVGDWFVFRILGRSISEARVRLIRRGGIGAAIAGVLTMGLAAAFAAGAMFTYLLDNVTDGDGLAQVDQPVSLWVANHREGWLTGLMRVVTQLGSLPAVTVIGVLGSVTVAIGTRRWAPVILMAVCAAGLQTCVTLVKVVVGRARPQLATAIATPSGYSFPSGHAASICAVAGLLAVLTCRLVVTTWTMQVLVWTVTVLIVAGVGASRVYLGVHFPTDVLAGWVLGGLWAAFVATAGAWWVTDTREVGH